MASETGIMTFVDLNFVIRWLYISQTHKPKATHFKNTVILLT